jgi:hypothetical protein
MQQAPLIDSTYDCLRYQFVNHHAGCVHIGYNFLNPAEASARSCFRAQQQQRHAMIDWSLQGKR